MACANNSLTKISSGVQNGDWVWTKKRALAAELIAEDELTDEQISLKLGVHRNSVSRWKRCQEFRDRISELTAAHAKDVFNRGIARREKRVAARQDRWQRGIQVIQERAADPEMQNVPGGKTGLLVRQVKSVGFGKDSQIIEEYAVDTGLMRELSNLEKETAQDLGQWSEKTDASGNNVNISVEYVDRKLVVTTEEQKRLPEPATTEE